MKPYLICHMIASVDGRTLLRRWRPVDESRGALFERLHEWLGSDAWLVGRVTGQEYAKLDAYPQLTEQAFPREPWFARRNAAASGIVLDPQGKIAWGRADIGGDPIVVVLADTVSDAHLAGLRKDGVSYIFAGGRELDLRRALDILNEELGIRRLELNGGGVTNGSFLRAGLIDDISLAISRGGRLQRRALRLRLARCRARHGRPGPRDDPREQRGAGRRRGMAALSARKRVKRAAHSNRVLIGGGHGYQSTSKRGRRGLGELGF
jgi:riboflavin biosynthesis pyrimidine reductase